MKVEVEQAIRVKSIALDIVEEVMKDQSRFNEKDLKHATELLARCVCDMVNLYTGLSEDHETTLKGTVTKAKVSYNSIMTYKKHFV
ncbi:hypothetical protein JOC86_003178 [Bacillus pakistanensis]|uniref:Uncharacterized protein n=1 Tax=Rossellomorea pakistanensis TaxID=992288 RepID=A0ABS2NFJ3_9BACI|nr:hypothetical protein [Bacillus pakistanensis]MBM7586626.1 hypothetical protein [Bacillus pakistanensis]